MKNTGFEFGRLKFNRDSLNKKGYAELSDRLQKGPLPLFFKPAGVRCEVSGVRCQDDRSQASGVIQLGVRCHVACRSLQESGVR